MNEKLKATWKKIVAKIKPESWFKPVASMPPASLDALTSVTTPAPRPTEEAPKKKIWKGTWSPDEIEQIAEAMGDEDGNFVPPISESKTQYNVNAGLFDDHRRKIGGKPIETSVYKTRDGILLGYTSKLKRNDGSIETVEVLAAEEIERRIQEANKVRAIALGFLPRCPECKTLLPEGTVLGMGKSHNQVTDLDGYEGGRLFGMSRPPSLEKANFDDPYLDSPAKVIKVNRIPKKRKSRRKK